MRAGKCVPVLQAEPAPIITVPAPSHDVPIITVTAPSHDVPIITVPEPEFYCGTPLDLQAEATLDLMELTRRSGE